MFGFQEPLEQMFLYSITLQNQTPRMINVILSLNIIVVYVTHVNCTFFNKLDMLWIYSGFNHMDRHGVCHMWDRNRYD